MSVIVKKLNGANGRGGASLAGLFLNLATLDDAECYRRWRAWKLEGVRRFLAAPVVGIRDSGRLGRGELLALGARVGAMNFALYRMERGGDDGEFGHRGFLALCRRAGFRRVVANPFSHSSGVSEICVAGDARRRAYIPYSDRALNWHTDGYYNPPDRRINGFAMHTVRPAGGGGENRLLDHEVLYLLLRDRDPALAACLFAPDVMSIPPGIQAHGAARAAQTGPVFSLAGGRLHMGFTMRKRHIQWKPSSPVRAALAEIRAILADENNPYILTRRFAAGEGIISNNVLHDRAAFVDADEGETAGRLVLRARFYDSVGG